MTHNHDSLVSVHLHEAIQYCFDALSNALAPCFKLVLCSDIAHEPLEANAKQ